MKKVLFCLVATMAMLMSSCTFETGTGDIEWGIAKQGTVDQLENGNYLGSPLRYFNALLDEFVNNGFCIKVSDTFSGGEVYTNRAMTATELKLFVLAHAEMAESQAEKNIKAEGYSVPSHASMTLRIRYKIATREEWSVQDIQIPQEYYMSEEDRAEAEDNK